MSDLVERLREQWEPGGDIYAACDEIERLQAEVERLGRCHRIVAMQVAYYKPELPDFTKVDMHLGVLRAAERCAGKAPWESDAHQQSPDSKK